MGRAAAGRAGCRRVVRFYGLPRSERKATYAGWWLAIKKEAKHYWVRRAGEGRADGEWAGGGAGGKRGWPGRSWCRAPSCTLNARYTSLVSAHPAKAGGVRAGRSACCEGWSLKQGVREPSL